jgi:hypothetical protein
VELLGVWDHWGCALEGFTLSLAPFCISLLPGQLPWGEHYTLLCHLCFTTAPQAMGPSNHGPWTSDTVNQNKFFLLLFSQVFCHSNVKWLIQCMTFTYLKNTWTKGIILAFLSHSRKWVRINMCKNYIIILHIWYMYVCMHVFACKLCCNLPFFGGGGTGVWTQGFMLAREAL